MVFFQSGLPNQMPNFSIDQPAPFRGEEMPKLVDDDHQVEDHEDFDDDEGEFEDIQEHG